MGLNSVGGRNLQLGKQGAIALSLSLSPSLSPDMTDIPLKKDVKSQIIHPFIGPLQLKTHQLADQTSITKSSFRVLQVGWDCFFM